MEQTLTEIIAGINPRFFFFFFFLIITLGNGKLLITPNHVYAGSNKLDLTQDTNTVYTHPSTIQCNASTEINNLKSSVSNGKIQVANAITGKGVSASGNDSFATVASMIGQLQSRNTFIKQGSSIFEHIHNSANTE